MSLHIAILLGSVREGRKTHLIAYYLEQLLQEMAQIQVSLIDLAKQGVPFFISDWEQEADPAPSLAHISQALERADAIILVSPEYHGSYSGVLKNAVDHYSREFKRKPIGVVSVGSGRFGGINASVQMQHLILSLGAYPVPRKLLVPFVNKAFDNQNQPIAAGLTENTQNFLREFLWFSKAIARAKVTDD